MQRFADRRALSGVRRLVGQSSAIRVARRSRGSSRRCGTRPRTTPGCIVWQIAGHRSRELIGDGHAVEVHAAAHPDVARAPQHDRALGVVFGQRRVGPAHEAAAPRRGVERRLRVDDAVPVDRPRETRLAVDPEPHVGRRRSRGRGAGSRRRRRASSRPHAACVIAWHAVSNWCVQFCFGSVHAPAAVNRREAACPRACGGERRRRGRSPTASGATCSRTRSRARRRGGA